MATTDRAQEQDEPMGIVISRGSREQAVPRFSAFMYAPAPEDEPPVRQEPRAA